MGLVPLHVWLPLAHPAAPMPASAVLSGAIIKAGVIGLIRFLPFDGALPDWGAVLTAVGLLTAFYGVAVGITQANPKTVLAYSSVSQMGLDRRGARHGAGRGRWRRRDGGRLLRGAPRAGQGRAVPRRGRGRGERRAPPVAGAAAGGGAGARLRRAAAHRRRRSRSWP